MATNRKACLDIRSPRFADLVDRANWDYDALCDPKHQQSQVSTATCHDR